MAYLPPFVIHGAHRMNEADIEVAAGHYRGMLAALRDDRIDLAGLGAYQTLNDALGILPMYAEVTKEVAG
jgi:glutathione-regulated potassium-efflux system ancillary protein KefG